MERDPADLVEAHFSGELDEAGAAELRAWLREDQQRFEQIAAQSRLEAALNHVYQTRQLQDVIETADVFDELREGQGPSLDEHAIPQIEWSRHGGSSPHSKTLGVIGFIGRQVLRRYAVGIASVAAVLVLTVVLVFVLRGMRADPADLEVMINDTPVEPGGNEPDETPTPPAPMIVATLTADRDAAWTRGALVPGSQLRAGERFSLTQGFAEITTNRGAAAILEAPATIELIDHHTIHLHTGKLVGLCYTESSKGFTVKTDHAEIIDVGTEFGVTVDEQRGTEVQVLSGSVRLEPVRESSPFKPVDAKTGDAFWVQDAVTPERVAARPSSFYRALPFAYERLIRADEPTVYWRFDALTERGQLPCVGRENMSLTGLDRSDLVTNPAPISGAGRSLWLSNAERQPIQCDQPISLNYASGLTVEAWIWAPAHPDIRMRVISNGEIKGGEHPTRGFGLGITGKADQIDFVQGPALMFTGFGDFGVASTEAVPVQRWSHIAATVDAQGKIRLVIDGREVTHRRLDLPPSDQQVVDQRGITIQPSTAPLRIGASPNESNWIGGIDEVAIYDRALSLEEIATRAQRSVEQP